MNKLFLKKIILYSIIVLLVFLADRVSKLYILSVLESTGTVDININSHIDIRHKIILIEKYLKN